MDFTEDEKKVFSKMGKQSRKNFFTGKTPEERSAYMKRVRSFGKKKDKDE